MTDTFTLDTNDLFSRFGFYDGGLLRNWAQRHPRFDGLDYSELLCRAVEQHLVPLLGKNVVVARQTTDHNPIRIVSVDDDPVDYIDPDGPFPIEFVSVDVAVNDLETIAATILAETPNVCDGCYNRFADDGVVHDRYENSTLCLDCLPDDD